METEGDTCLFMTPAQLVCAETPRPFAVLMSSHLAAVEQECEKLPPRYSPGEAEAWADKLEWEVTSAQRRRRVTQAFTVYTCVNCLY